jgi:hypothetical protein
MRTFSIFFAALLAVPTAFAHVLPVRPELSGFLRRAEVIVRARVVHPTKTVSTEPYRARTRVTILAVHRGEPPREDLTVVAEDDHGATYDRGQEVVLFLGAYRADLGGFPAQQRAGEAILLENANEAHEWDAYVAAATPIVSTNEDPVTHEEFRTAALSALGASSARLRREAARILSPAIARGVRADLASRVVDVFARSSLPAAARMEMIGVAAPALLPAEWLSLARAEHDARVHVELLDIALTTAERRDPAVVGESISIATRALTSTDPVRRVGAAATLARVLDPRGERTLLETATTLDVRDPASAALVRPLLRGLFFRAKNLSAPAHAALALLGTKLSDESDRRFVEGALRDLAALYPPAGEPRSLPYFVGGALAAAALLVLCVWIVWRRKRLHDRHGEDARAMRAGHA